jgi:NCS1 family nucleobase:cation symporter-1
VEVKIVEDGSSFPALKPVPPEDRPFGFADCFALWSSLGVGLLVLQAGALLVPGLGFASALGATVLGSLIGVVLLALVGVIGSDTGVATMAALRPSLGARGSTVPTAVNILQLIGWGAFEIIIMRDSADAIGRRILGVSSPIVWTLVWGTLATAMAFGGPLAFVRRFLKTWGIWLVYAGALWLTIKFFMRYDIRSLLAKAGTGDITFGVAVDLVVAMPLSWLPLIADYTRFGRRTRPVFWGTFAGYFIANVWFYALGAAYALVTSGADLLQSILLTSGGLIALGLILLDETDNAFADIYSAAVSTGNFSSRFSATHLSIAYGPLCTLLALLVPIGQYQDFLLLLGSVFAPLFGIVLTDHFVVRRRQIAASELDRPHGAYWYAAGWSWPALLAWVAGIVVFQLVTRLLPHLGATLPSFLASGAIYLLLAGIGIVRARPVVAVEQA